MRAAALGAVSNHGTLQRMPDPGTEADLVRSMVTKIFVEGRGYNVLHGRLYRVGGETCAQSLSKALNASPVIAWMIQHLAKGGLGDRSANRDFTHRGAFPMLPVGMRFLLSLTGRGIRCRERKSHKNK